MPQRGSADSEKDGRPQFAEVFVIVWFGTVTITLNSKLLGGNISFFFFSEPLCAGLLYTSFDSGNAVLPPGFPSFCGDHDVCLIYHSLHSFFLPIASL